jgi:hypothetical protein
MYYLFFSSNPPIFGVGPHPPLCLLRLVERRVLLYFLAIERPRECLRVFECDLDRERRECLDNLGILINLANKIK